MENPPITDEQLRSAGFTKKAKKYPLTERAVRARAHVYGVSFEVYTKNPAAWYAPNAHCRETDEGRGIFLEAGEPLKSDDGRWLSLEQMLAMNPGDVLARADPAI